VESWETKIYKLLGLIVEFFWGFSRVGNHIVNTMIMIISEWI